MSKSSDELRQALKIGGSNEKKKKKSKILLWHRRLGHASFGYMKKLFLIYLQTLMSLVSNVMFVNLQIAIVLRF